MVLVNFLLRSQLCRSFIGERLHMRLCFLKSVICFISPCIICTIFPFSLKPICLVLLGVTHRQKAQADEDEGRSGGERGPMFERR